MLSDNCTGYPAYIGDLYCDDTNNNIDCHFDGGDCCYYMPGLSFCNQCACLRGKIWHTVYALWFDPKSWCSN